MTQISFSYTQEPHTIFFTFVYLEWCYRLWHTNLSNLLLVSSFKYINLAHYSKNAVSANQILCKLLSSTLEDFWRSLHAINTLPLLLNQTYVHTSFYHSSELTRNLTFNGSIYYVLYLQKLRFYLVRQISYQTNHYTQH